MTAAGDYAKQIHIGATPEKVFDTLTSAAEFASWWAPATGSAAEAGELTITFDSIEDPLVVQVKQATRSSTVIWDVESCAFLPDWAGTTPAFTLSRSSAGGCDLEFRHEGLSTQLECYDMCRAGWDRVLECATPPSRPQTPSEGCRTYVSPPALGRIQALVRVNDWTTPTPANAYGAGKPTPVRFLQLPCSIAHDHAEMAVRQRCS